MTSGSDDSSAPACGGLRPEALALALRRRLALRLRLRARSVFSAAAARRGLGLLLRAPAPAARPRRGGPASLSRRLGGSPAESASSRSGASGAAASSAPPPRALRETMARSSPFGRTRARRRQARPQPQRVCLKSHCLGAGIPLARFRARCSVRVPFRVAAASPAAYAAAGRSALRFRSTIRSRWLRRAHAQGSTSAYRPARLGARRFEVLEPGVRFLDGQRLVRLHGVHGREG